MINTLKPGSVEKKIKRAMKERKENHAVAHNKYIDVDNEMLDLIRNSNHISKGKSPLIANIVYSQQGQKPADPQHAHQEAHSH